MPMPAGLSTTVMQKPGHRAATGIPEIIAADGQSPASLPFRLLGLQRPGSRPARPEP